MGRLSNKGTRRFGGSAGWVVATCVLAAVSGGRDGFTLARVPASQTGPPVFRGGANFVIVDAYPRKDGKIVEGLTGEDFQIFEDGKPQVIDRVEFVRVEPGITESRRRDPNNLNEMWALVADPHNRVFVAFLDTLHTTVAESNAARRPLVDALDRIVGPDDLFGVMTQDTRPEDVTFGRRLLTVANQLADHWAWGERQRLSYGRRSVGEEALTACFHMRANDDPWMITDDGKSRFFDEVLIDRRREDEVLTALQSLIEYLGRQRESRTALLVITDGWVLFPEDRSLTSIAHADSRARSLPRPGERPIGGGGARPQDPGTVSVSAGDDDPSFASCLVEATRLAELDQVRHFRAMIAQANERNVSIYPVAMSQLAVFDTDLGNPVDLSTDLAHVTSRARNLRTVAESTDGIALVGTNDLTGGLRRIADDLSAYYLLGYYSTNTKMDGRLRKIDVKMKTVGLSVHARRGYLASGRGGDMSASSAVVTTTLPVDEAFGVLGRLRDSSDMFLNGVRIDDDLIVAVEISNRQAALPAWAHGANVVVQVADATGRPVGDVTATIDAGARGATVRIPAGGTSGPWRLTARVTGDAASVSERGEIRVPTGVIVGDGLLFRSTLSSRAPLWPAADFQFRRTERLHAEWPILRPLDQRMARLLDRRGQPLPVSVPLTERDVGGRTVVAVDLALAALADGDYVIELVAGSGGVTERKLTGIRVTQ